ncbi:hypothetical protein ACFX2F_047103 [Malus domestica]
MAYEFSTLCELDVCMTICGPKQTGRPPELHTWPENQNETKVCVDTYRARKEMYEAKYPTWDERIESLSENRLEALLNSLDAKLESGKRTLLHKRNQSAEHYQHICSSSQSRPCNYYKQDQPFDHHHNHHHQQPSDRVDSSNEYLSNLLAPNPSKTAMWMLMERTYNYSTLQLSVGPSSSNSELLFEGQHINFNNPMMIQKRRLMLPAAVPYMQYPTAGVSSHQVRQVHASLR